MPLIAKMDLSGRKKDIACVCLLTTLLAGPGIIKGETVKDPIPKTRIEVLADEQSTPSWKKLWDHARTLAAVGNTREAAVVYGELFSRRPQLEQASWEYCQLLRNLGDSKTAARVIASLLERKPNHTMYLLSGGAIALENRDWQSAAKYFGRVLEAEPVGESADRAMRGLMTSLRGQGRRDQAFAIAERLLARHGNDGQLLHETAEEAKALGRTDKAKRLLQQLVARPTLDDKAIIALIASFDQPEFSSEIEVLCEIFLQRHPDHLPYRKRLSSRYLEAGRFDEALRHLSVLAEQQEDNDNYLLLAGRISFRHAKRLDKALMFLERYIQKHPDDAEVAAELGEIRRVLAEDLAVIVENDGAHFLWEDLTKITPLRNEIFKKLADLLELKGAGKEYLEVLSILHQQQPEDDETGLRLAKLYFETNNYEQAGRVLDRLDPHKNRDKAFHLLRAGVLQVSGRVLEALAAMESALQLDPGDHNLRREVIHLAGMLGETRRMRLAFSSPTNRMGKPGMEWEDVFLYLEQVNTNHLFGEFQSVVAGHRSELAREPKIFDKIDLLSAAMMRRQGKTHQAEQLLRTMLIEKRSVAAVLLTLAELAIEEKKFHDARAWLGYLSSEEVEKIHAVSDVQRLRRLILEVQISRWEGDAHETSQFLDRLGTVLAAFSSTDSPEMATLLARIEIERCWLSWQQGDPRHTVGLLAELSSKAREIADYYILLALCGKSQQHIGATAGQPPLAGLAQIVELQLLPEIVEGLMRRQEYGLAQSYLRQLQRHNSESVLAKILQVRLSLARGNYDEANNHLRWLAKRHPDEKYFPALRIGIAMRTGDYGNGLALWEKLYGAVNNLPVANSQIAAFPVEDFESGVTLARLLWASKQQDRALEVYRGVLSPSVETVLQEKFRERQIAYPDPHGEKNWWDTLLQIVQSTPDIVSQLMEVEVFLANIDNEVSEIVTEWYGLFQQQKIVIGEYQARKAIVQRKYAAAELSSKRVVEEHNSPEGMIDLAAVYGRVGKYRKEAQVYEALQSTGTTSPELQVSMERSSQQLSPQNTIDVAHGDKHGRNGIIDLQATKLGSSFRITPNLDSEVFVSYTNNRYRSTKPSAIVQGNTLYMTTIYEVARDYELHLGGGGHKMDDDSNLLLLHEMGVKGRLDRYFSAFLEWRKDMVEDNVTSLESLATFQQFDAGIICDTPLGLTVGGDFRHRNYSDANNQNRFHVFSAYGVYGDSIHLEARYDYQYLANTDSGPDEEFSTRLDPTAEVLYWKPSFWSEHLWAVKFQHDFFGFEDGNNRRNSYYSIVNAIGFEDGDSPSYQGKFDIFLEMSPHFLLKSNFTLIKGDKYEEKGLTISLHYRW